MKNASYILLVVLSVCLIGCLNQVSKEKDRGNVALRSSCPSYYDEPLGKEINTSVDSMPEYPGGMNAFLTFFMKRYKSPSESDFQASFSLEVITDADGSVLRVGVKDKNETDITVAEEEALRVLKLMPQWIPGRCNGKPVPVRMYIPLRF